MSDFIVGNDISEFQGQVDFSTYKNNSNFLIMKSSEGTSYIDHWFGNNRAQARYYGLPCGFYHFAKPDIGNSPEDEAKFFCALMDGDPLREGEMLVLDFEVQYFDPVGWCKRWLDYVSNHFNGVKPLMYLNQSLATSYDWQPVVDAGYGLWIAAYTYDPSNNNFQTGKWPFAAMQQWTDVQNVPGIVGNIDGDVFFGDAEAFKKYGYHAPQPVVEPQVTPTTSEIPVPVTTSGGEVNVPITVPSSGGTSSAKDEGNTEQTVNTTQTPKETKPTKPPLPLGQAIVFKFMNIFGALKEVWVFIWGK